MKEDAVVPVTAPTGLHAHAQTPTSISVMWTASTAGNGIKHYEVYRNGASIGTTSDTMYIDRGLKANTSSGERVSYHGAVYEAQWWTKGETPGQAGVWKKVQ